MKMLKIFLQLYLIVTSLINIYLGLKITGNERYSSSIYPSTANHIEEDEKNTGQLIIATFQSLGTLQHDKHLETFVGNSQSGYREGQGLSARFNLITSFHQVNFSHIIVVDKRNHCLRLVNRTTNSTSPFAGRCGSHGFNDGEGTEARFNEPHTIVSAHRTDQYYLTDSKNSAVRLLRVSADYQSVRVETVLRDDRQLINLRSLAVNPKENHLLLSTGFRLLEVNGTKNYSTISSKEVYRNIEDLYILPSVDILLVADHDGIYQFDLLNSQKTYVWNASLNGSCPDKSPNSVSASGKQLYVGYQNCVEVLTLEETIPQYTTTHKVTLTTSPSVMKTTSSVKVEAKTAKPEAIVSDGGSSSDFLSFNDWTSYAVLVLAAAVGLLIAVLLAMIVRRKRRGVQDQAPTEPPPLPPCFVRAPVYEEFRPKPRVPPGRYALLSHGEDREVASWDSSANCIIPYAVGYRCQSSGSSSRPSGENIPCSPEELHCLQSSSHSSTKYDNNLYFQQPCMEEAKNDFSTN